MTNQLARDVGLHVKKDPTTSDDHPGYWIYKTMNKLPTTQKKQESRLASLIHHPMTVDLEIFEFVE